jgi:uncharacterized linocin/CFP29 family protein
VRYLPREDAPFSDRVWQMIDEAAIGSARSQLAGRRVLEITGPMGLGVRGLEQGEKAVGVEVKRGRTSATMSSASAIPVPLISADFMISVRDIAAAEERGQRLELRQVVDAAIATAHLEDMLIFEGNRELGIEGLLTAEGSEEVQIGDWHNVGQAMDDLIVAVTKLDSAGFAGPYTAALSPPIYNALFLRYPQGNQTQLEHARQIIASGLVKAPTLKSGGVLLAAGREFATIMMGQDMTVGYAGPSGSNYELVIMESLTPYIPVPEAICILRHGK